MVQKETFGEVIRKLREESGLPLRKVAAHLDIDPSTLGKIERNERTANKEMIEKFAEIFSINSKPLLVSPLARVYNACGMGNQNLITCINKDD